MGGCESSDTNNHNSKKGVMYLSKDGSKNKEKLLKINPNKLKFLIKGAGPDGYEAILEMEGTLTETEEGKYVITPQAMRDQGKLYKFQN